MESILKMLEKAKGGVVFHGDDKRQIGEKIESLNEKSTFKKLTGLLEVIIKMHEADDYTLLNVGQFALETSPQDNNKLNVIFNFVKEHYTRAIKLEEVAEIAGMTVPAFCRYFKKITRKTFTAFVNEYRVAHAAKLLHEKQISISEVCFDSGFNNISHFNRLFKDFFGKTPSVYRDELKYLVS
jgi:AraC-like DNA-binding protein